MVKPPYSHAIAMVKQRLVNDYGMITEIQFMYAEMQFMLTEIQFMKAEINKGYLYPIEMSKRDVNWM